MDSRCFAVVELTFEGVLVATGWLLSLIVAIKFVPRLVHVRGARQMADPKDPLRNAFTKATIDDVVPVLEERIDQKLKIYEVSIVGEVNEHVAVIRKGVDERIAAITDDLTAAVRTELEQTRADLELRIKSVEKLVAPLARTVVLTGPDGKQVEVLALEHNIRELGGGLQAVAEATDRLVEEIPGMVTKKAASIKGREMVEAQIDAADIEGVQAADKMSRIMQYRASPEGAEAYQQGLMLQDSDDIAEEMLDQMKIKSPRARRVAKRVFGGGVAGRGTTGTDVGGGRGKRGPLPL